MKRRLFALALALLLAVSLPVSALARDWYIDDGDITISATESGQTVSQGSTSEADDAPVIKQRDSETATGSTITIKSTGDATANVTIKDVNISSKGDAIDVDGKSSAKITLEGKNKIFSETGSALHVSSGDVTIDGDGSLEAGIQDDIEGSYNHNAKIGSHEDENMSGTIHITGDATVTTDDNAALNYFGDGAGIGSGEDGNMSGTIIIDGNAHVEASSNDRGAGIGSGEDGNVSGKIIIGGSETVPTAPGTYPVTCVVRFGDETLEFQIGTLIVPEPSAEAAQPAPVYHVTDKDGNQISYTAAREGGVLTIRVDAAYARLTLTADEAQALTAQGVEKVVFITTGATSAFRPADLTAYASEAPFVLTHDGETVTFTAGETDLASLLLQA